MCQSLASCNFHRHRFCTVLIYKFKLILSVWIIGNRCQDTITMICHCYGKIISSRYYTYPI